MGSAPADTLAQLRDRAPLIYDTLIESMFAGPLSHPELGRTQRELATVAVLAALGGAERQLATHTPRRAPARPPAQRAARAVRARRRVRGLPARAERGRRRRRGRPGGKATRGRRELRHVTLEDHETVVAEAGESGPPVLLVHALGLDWRMWEPVMNDARATAARVRLRHPRPRPRGGLAGPLHDGRHGGRPRRRARRARARARARRRPLLRRRRSRRPRPSIIQSGSRRWRCSPRRTSRSPRRSRPAHARARSTGCPRRSCRR